MCVQVQKKDQELDSDLVENPSVQTRFFGPESEVKTVLDKVPPIAESGFGNISYIHLYTLAGLEALSSTTFVN
jgi:hypothetical protein